MSVRTQFLLRTRRQHRRFCGHVYCTIALSRTFPNIFTVEIRRHLAHHCSRRQPDIMLTGITFCRHVYGNDTLFDCFLVWYKINFFRSGPSTDTCTMCVGSYDYALFRFWKGHFFIFKSTICEYILCKRTYKAFRKTLVLGGNAYKYCTCL